MKAIVTTSANPLHYGHMSLYNEAVKIFGRGNVQITIGKNANKNIDFGRILYHIKPYGVDYEIAENITLSDYCKNNNIDYIVRGIRNAVDAEYELKLDFLNKEINCDIQTMFFPTKDIFSNISSSSINELLKYNKYDVVKKYMNEDAMYRYINVRPEFIVFFGKSCIGKTYYLENIAFEDKSIKTINVDKIFWNIFEKCYGKSERVVIEKESRDRIYTGLSLEDLFEKYSTIKFWETFFTYIKNNFAKHYVGNYTKLDINKEVYLLDFPAIGSYWNTIPSYLKGKLYLISLINNNTVNRNNFIKNKGFEKNISYLDDNYKEPDYFDEKIDLSNL